MDAVQAAARCTAAGGDTAAHMVLRTTDVDEARAFRRGMFSGPLRVSPIGDADLAAIAGVGVRVLQEAFRQHVGMSPLAYLRRLRLDGVHAELARADPWEVGVGEVAYRWGFTHLGRFAGAYRARYGVPPSQTLEDRA